MDDEKICTICLSSLDSNLLTTKFQCDHQYHMDCISSWLRNHSTCPICRKQLVEPKTLKQWILQLEESMKELDDEILLLQLKNQKVTTLFEYFDIEVDKINILQRAFFIKMFSLLQNKHLGFSKAFFIQKYGIYSNNSIYKKVLKKICKAEKKILALKIYYDDLRNFVFGAKNRCLSSSRPKLQKFTYKFHSKFKRLEGHIKTISAVTSIIDGMVSLLKFENVVEEIEIWENYPNQNSFLDTAEV